MQSQQEDAPAGETRRALADGTFKLTGDPAKMVDAMIACANASPAPLRLTLGSTAYISHCTWLAALDAQKEVAFLTDLDA